MCYPDPHSAGGPNGGLPFRLKLMKIMKHKQNGRKRHAKTLSSISCLDVFKRIENTSTFLELVLCLSCEVVMAWLDGPDEQFTVCAMQTCDYSKEVQRAG